MPKLDELRQLIQQVADKDGPLHIDGDYIIGRRGSMSLPGMVRLDMFFDRQYPNLGGQDVLAGVLRRDLERVVRQVVHEVWPHSMDHHQRHLVRVWSPKVRDVAALGATTLEAHINCWLAAHEAGLVGRKEPPTVGHVDGVGLRHAEPFRPPRPDLYDARKPREDDDEA